MVLGNGVIEIGWAFAGLSAFGGVLFLVKMALRKPTRRTAKDMMQPIERLARKGRDNE